MLASRFPRFDRVWPGDDAAGAMDRDSDLEMLRSLVGESMVAFVKGSASLIAVVTREGDLLYLNPAGRRVLGLASAVGGRIAELLLDGGLTWERDFLPRALESGESHSELCFRNALTDGKIPVQLSAFVSRTDRGEPVELVLEGRDLTAQKEAESHRRLLESELSQAVKMEAVGRLAGGIAHDFNNLITAMAGFSEIVLDHLEAGHPLREGAERTLTICERSAGIVRQLLAVSRRQPFEPLALDLNRLVQETLKLLRSLIGEDILVTTVLSTEPLVVHADPAQIEQVLLNLLVNARDAMPRGGRLTVSADGVEAGEDGGPPRVRIRVTDTGHGMDDETRARVFEPFFTTRKKGSGLGLATVYGIVIQSGGSIRVESRPREGATFTVELPRIVSGEEIAARRASVPVGSKERREPSGSETILVVDDDPAVRLVIHDTLRTAGYTVLVAQNGDEALEVVDVHVGPIHLLLSDVVMPGMDGEALAGRVASRRPGIKVLYMSGHAADAIAHRGLFPDAVLDKPFTREILTRRIRDVLEA